MQLTFQNLFIDDEIRYVRLSSGWTLECDNYLPDQCNDCNLSAYYRRLNSAMLGESKFFGLLELSSHNVELFLVLIILLVTYATWKLYWSLPDQPCLSYVVPMNSDLQQQSKTLIGHEDIHYSIMSQNEYDFAVRFHSEVTTVFENFLHGMLVSGDGPCFGTREPGPNGQYKWLTYGEAFNIAKRFGVGIKKLGIKPGQNSFVGVYSRTRWEWDVVALGCTAHSIVIIPLYDTLGADSARFIVNQAGIELIVCDNMSKVHKLVSNLSEMSSLKYIVVMDYVAQDESNEIVRHQNDAITIVSFEELVKNSDEDASELFPPKPDDLYIICYTSGTTGHPKGVMLSHSNLMTQVSSLRRYFAFFGIELHANESIISYLPMAHMIGQITHMFTVSYGARIGFYGGDITKLTDDMRILGPSYFPAVPRLLNRLKDEVQKKLAMSNFFKRSLFHLSFYMKSRIVVHGIIHKDTIWDRLVFKRIQEQLGGNVRAIVTGSAPILSDVKLFSWVALGSCVIEAYGATEVTGAVTITWPHDVCPGHAGSCLPNCLIKLVKVPELDHNEVDADSQVGEICVKGPCVSLGYFKNPIQTAELMGADGWLCTGDIGAWTRQGTLRIIDRRKSILKLAQGEYVSPEKIENIYSTSRLVSQIFVDGNSFENFLVAIVVPNMEVLRQAIAEDLGYVLDDCVQNENLTRDERVEDYILEKLRQIGKEKGLNSLEQVKFISLSHEPFTIERGLLTPTLKIRRFQLRNYFKNQIRNLYANIR